MPPLFSFSPHLLYNNFQAQILSLSLSLSHIHLLNSLIYLSLFVTLVMAFNHRKGPILFSPKAIADAASWYCALVLVALVLLSMFRDSSLLQNSYYNHANFGDNKSQEQQQPLLSRPCEEIYVVGEGETLHTISDKCGDPFIVENNPHIHDPDDVFPGLVIKIITPSHHI